MLFVSETELSAQVEQTLRRVPLCNLSWTTFKREKENEREQEWKYELETHKAQFSLVRAQFPQPVTSRYPERLFDAFHENCAQQIYKEILICFICINFNSFLLV